MSEVDEVSQGLGKELRGAFAAALALAQLVAQRRASRLRVQAEQTGELEGEARRRFEVEQRTQALGIPLPTADMSPQQLAESWAKAEVARSQAPEVAEFWDARARAAGVEPADVREQWWHQQQAPAGEDPAVFTAAVAGLGAEGAAAAADTDRARAEDLQLAADRETAAGDRAAADRADAERDAAVAQPGSDEEQQTQVRAVDAETEVDQRDTTAGRLADDSEHLQASAVEHEVAATSPGVWQDGHPPARLAGQAYGVRPGRGASTGRSTSRSSGRGLAAAKQREHGLDR